MSETRMSNIDLNIIPLHRQAAKNLDSLPGLHTANPSRKTSRSRRSDQLMLMLLRLLHLLQKHLHMQTLHYVRTRQG